jgi:hypothetical protein
MSETPLLIEAIHAALPDVSPARCRFAALNVHEYPLCHCGRVLNPALALDFDAPGAPGPIVSCDNCGCSVAIPPRERTVGGHGRFAPRSSPSSPISRPASCSCPASFWL